MSSDVVVTHPNIDLWFLLVLLRNVFLTEWSFSWGLFALWISDQLQRRHKAFCLWFGVDWHVLHILYLEHRTGVLPERYDGRHSCAVVYKLIDKCGTFRILKLNPELWRSTVLSSWEDGWFHMIFYITQNHVFKVLLTLNSQICLQLAQMSTNLPTFLPLLTHMFRVGWKKCSHLSVFFSYIMNTIVYKSQ